MTAVWDGEAGAPEGELVRAAARGDASAFARLFDQTAPSVLRFARDLAGSQAAADEVTQETFVRAHRRLDRLGAGDRVLPWLFGIARNVSREQRRDRMQAMGGADAIEPLTRASDVSPEGQLLEREADEMLGAALARLDDDRRAALVMRLDHDLSYDEIASAMGWPLAKVKNEIHRARGELRTMLGPYLGGSR